MLESNLGYKFKNNQLLKMALTHRSVNLHEKKYVSNERLEFLGDSILGFSISQYLYENYPNFDEGKLTKLRATVVCEESLSNCAEKLEVGKYLIMGRGEEMTDGRTRPSTLADAMEAIFAAIYLDSDIITIKNIIIKFLEPYILNYEKQLDKKDTKTTLQEFLQYKDGSLPKYEIVKEEGPDHAKLFTVNVLVEDKILGSGTGKSKKEAEKNAAEKALEKIMN